MTNKEAYPNFTEWISRHSREIALFGALTAAAISCRGDEFQDVSTIPLDDGLPDATSTPLAVVIPDINPYPESTPCPDEIEIGVNVASTQDSERSADVESGTDDERAIGIVACESGGGIRTESDDIGTLSAEDDNEESNDTSAVVESVVTPQGDISTDEDDSQISNFGVGPMADAEKFVDDLQVPDFPPAGKRWVIDGTFVQDGKGTVEGATDACPEQSFIVVDGQLAGRLRACGIPLIGATVEGMPDEIIVACGGRKDLNVVEMVPITLITNDGSVINQEIGCVSEDTYKLLAIAIGKERLAEITLYAGSDL